MNPKEKIVRNLNNGVKKGVITLLLIIKTFTKFTIALRSNSCNFPAIFNFGDSNSDTGSASVVFGRVPSPFGDTFFGQPSGRYSDGRLIVDFLANELNLPHLSSFLDSHNTNYRHGANFAFDGATIEFPTGRLIDKGFRAVSLKTQLLQFDQFKSRSIESYRNGRGDGTPNPEVFSKALYTLDIGQNDLHFKLLTTSTIEDVLNSIPFLINQTSLAIEDLYEHGARAFWIHNTGPIGCLPRLLMSYPTEDIDEIGCIKSFNEVAEIFNKKLYNLVSQSQQQFQDAAFTYVNIYKAKYLLIKEGSRFGFTDLLGYCCKHHDDPNKHCYEATSVVNGTAVDVTSCSHPNEYISWDSIHYTDAANQWVARHVLEGIHCDPPRPVSEACRILPIEHQTKNFDQCPIRSVESDHGSI